MPITLDQFIENLTRSGLITADEVRTFQEGLTAADQPQDAQALARQLVKTGRLTRYQATAVYQGKVKGLVFGEYVVLDKLGEGGMGEVLKARHRRMDRLVALKILPAQKVDSPEAIRRFQHEVKAAARLMHPNIVAAHDAGEHQGIHYLVMEYVEGRDLAELVREHGTLSVPQATDCILQAARGLAYAHKHGVIHRDIKPSNLLLDHEGTVKILDMGLARLDEPPSPAGPQAERLTQSGQVMGTCDYMSPEQAVDTHRADQRADIYSLGCTLYRLLAGKPPYQAETLIQVLFAHREAPIPSLRAARTDVPEALESIYQRMMAKRPEDRYQSAAELVSALEGYNAAQSSGESSSDAALKVFLQNLSQAGASRTGKVSSSLPAGASKVSGTAAKKAAAFVSRSDSEETLTYQPEHPTGTGILARTVRAARRRNRMLLGIGGGLLGCVLLVALVWLLTHGREAQVGRIERSEARQSPSSQSSGGPRLARHRPTVIARPITIPPEPLPWKPGDPLSSLALVVRPAPIPGVRSWSLEPIGHRNGVCYAAYSADGRLLATSDRTGAVLLWDAASHNLKKMLVNAGEKTWRWTGPA